MQFLLSSYKRLVGLVIESDITEDGGCDKGTNLLDAGINGDRGSGCGQLNFLQLGLSEVKFECADQAGLREQIGSVVHAVELEVLLDDLAVLIALLVLFDLYSKLETKVIEPLEF